MAEIVHFSKQDATQRTGTAGGTSAQEVTQYTIAWSDLTTAGFANNDDVIIFVKANLGANSTTNNAEATFGIGTTFAGRTVLQTDRTECDTGGSAFGAREIGFLDRRTLVTNENFYVSIRIIATSTPNIEDYCFYIMKLGDLATDDFRYAEDTSSGNAPSTATDGASVTLPSGGGDDWLIISNTRWLVDSTTLGSRQRLNLDTNVRMEQWWEGEDTAETLDFLQIGYLPAASASAVCKVQYFNISTGTNDYTQSSIFALRLDAFADHIGNYTSSATSAGSVLDTFVQTNTVSLSLTSSGDIAWFGQTIADVALASQEPYHRIQLANVDIVTALGRRGCAAYDPTDQLQLSQFGTVNTTSGTKVIDMDCAEDLVITTSYNFDESTLVAFSLELAAGGGVTVALTGVGATSAIGSVSFTESGSVSITGVLGTSAVGSVGLSISGSLELSGVGITGPPGSVTPSISTALIGEASTANSGLLSNSLVIPITDVVGVSAIGSVVVASGITVPLTGVRGKGVWADGVWADGVWAVGVWFEGGGAVGAALPSTSVNLAGVSGTSAVDSVTAEGDVSVPLTGISGTSAIGNISFTEAGSVGLTSVLSTSGVGNLNGGASIPLVGESSPSAVDSVVVSNTQSLTGEESTVSVGTVLASAGTTVGLTGISSTSFVGSVAFAESGAINLTGVLSTTDVGSVSFTETGSVGLTEQPGGGYEFWINFEKELERRKEEKQLRLKRKRKAEKIADKLHRELYLAERKLEEEDARKAELARINRLASKNREFVLGLGMESVLKDALERQTFSTMERLERELTRMKEEEDFMLMATQIIMDQI